MIEFGRLSESQRAELEGDEVDPFDAAGNTLQWRPKDHHVALRGPEGRLVASAGLVLSDVQADGSDPVPVVGIGGVIVAAPYRGRGLANRLIDELLTRATTLGPDLAMLFCHRNRAGLYTRHGFIEISATVVAQQPPGLVEMQMVAMWRALREGARLPPGNLTLGGLPF